MRYSFENTGTITIFKYKDLPFFVPDKSRSVYCVKTKFFSSKSTIIQYSGVYGQKVKEYTAEYYGNLLDLLDTLDKKALFIQNLDKEDIVFAIYNQDPSVMDYEYYNNYSRHFACGVAGQLWYIYHNVSARLMHLYLSHDKVYASTFEKYLDNVFKNDDVASITYFKDNCSEYLPNDMELVSRSVQFNSDKIFKYLTESGLDSSTILRLLLHNKIGMAGISFLEKKGVL